MTDYIFHVAFEHAGTHFGRDALAKWIGLRLARDATCREVLGVVRLKRIRILMRRMRIGGDIS